jgi:F-type H+-transporting ATPase subunit gamma
MGAKVRELRRRERSVQSTQQITRAMELIAASRIVRAQARAQRSRPFARALNDMIAMLAGEVRGSPLLTERERITNAGLVVITSDRGLCGAYNSNVLREAERARRREMDQGRRVQVRAVGRKAIGFYKFRQVPLAAQHQGMSDHPTLDHAKEIAGEIIRQYVEGELDKVILGYTEFVSTFLQRARAVQILPVPRPEESEERKEGPRALFDFEPEPEELLDALLPRYVENRVYAALLESSASEHAARRRAMKSATDNASELLKVLRRGKNRARQSEITTEIADIVGGAEALRSGAGASR